MKKCVLKGNKLYFDDFFYISLNKEIISEFKLKNRIEIYEEEYQEIIIRRGINYGYFLLSKRDYSEKEFYLKLLEKCKEKEIVKKIVKKFIENGYLNDYEFGKFYISTHSYGKKKMEFMLLQKGVSINVIKELLEEENSNEELDRLKIQWTKLGNKEKSKKIASLMRKGFEYSDIKKVMKDLEVKYR